MDALFAIAGRDFVISVSDTSNARSIVRMKKNYDKTYKLSSHTLMSACGESGDIANFSEYIQGNVRLYSVRNSQDLSPSETANFIRNELASSLRSRNPYNVNMLVAGVDRNTGESSLYRIDYLAAMSKVPFAAHGYCAHFVYSVMDHEYKEDITLEQGFAIVKKCLTVLKERFIVDFPGFTIKVISSSGIREYSTNDI
ncbi:Proteasome subunit beta type-4 [Coemansia interrupta]|uniref:Proteasome subunit beta n=1 Tax=Coemansia interrupta TaxID=1126814 RepID=A0A9W8HIV1_9FUNG|nr:Proteasome subunit beta type-4 [Coemansia interrupta]